MYALDKSPSAKLRVRAPAMARRRARVRPHRLSFLLGGDDPENRIVEEIPAEGFGARRHAVRVLCFMVGSWGFSGESEDLCANIGAEIEPRLVQLVEIRTNGRDQPSLFGLHEDPQRAGKRQAIEAANLV
jgi:hypothetical protein